MNTPPLTQWRQSLRNPLTEDEIDHFHRLGYAGPFTLCSPQEMAPIRETIEKEILDSPPPSDRRRLGLAIRVTIPQVKVDHDRLFPGHRNILLRGEDFMGLNRLTDPPA